MNIKITIWSCTQVKPPARSRLVHTHILDFFGGKPRPTKDHSIPGTPKVEVISPCKSLRGEEFVQEIISWSPWNVLDTYKKKQQTGEQKWRFLAQKWGTTISLLGWFQSNQIWLRTKKGASPTWDALHRRASDFDPIEYSPRIWHEQTWWLWTSLNYSIEHRYIYIYVPTRVLGASCFLFSDCFFPHVYLCWPWWPSSVSRADRWRSGRNPAGTWEPSLPEAKEADLFPWYEYYDVNAR